MWLVCHDRCWTGEQLVRRGLHYAPSCVLYNRSEEAMAHIFNSCSFSGMVYQQSSHSRTQHFLEGHILGRHAHGMVHMEASRCDHLRQCTTQLSSFTSLDTIRTEGKEWVTMGASALARYYRRWTNLALDVSCCN